MINTLILPWSSFSSCSSPSSLDQTCGDCVAWFILGTTWFHRIYLKKKKNSAYFNSFFKFKYSFFFFTSSSHQKKRSKVNKTKQNKGGYTWLIWWNPISLLALKVGLENQRFKGFSAHNPTTTILCLLILVLQVDYCFEPLHCIF